MITYMADILYVVTDYTVSFVLNNLYEEKNYNIFIILTTLSFIFYPSAVYFIRKNPGVSESYNSFKNEHPSLSFWIILSHIAGLIYLPIGMAVFFIASGFRGNEYLVLAFFIIAPCLSIFTIRIIAKEDIKAFQNNTPCIRPAVFLIFIFAFAFFNLTFKKAGFFLCSALTFEVTGISEPAWYFLLFYKILFIWMFYLPMRLWLYMPEKGNKTAFASLVLSVIVIILSAFTG